jgi:hypothetical protein
MARRHLRGTSHSTACAVADVTLPAALSDAGLVGAGAGGRLPEV